MDANLPSALDAVRRERRERLGSRPPGQRPTIAVLADQPDDDLVAALTACGWHVSGVLPGDVFDGLLWAARTAGVERNYVELTELLLDPALDAACLVAGSPALPSVLRAGLHALLPAPVDVPCTLLRDALDTAEEVGVEHAVGFAARWTVPVATVTRLLDGEPAPQQITVRAWPTGPVATAELLDVVTAWCGDVVAVCAAPQALPARELPGGAQVRWAVLTERASTVLVAHDGAPGPVLRLSFPGGRLELTGDRVGWDDGRPIAVAPVPWPPDDDGLPVGPAPQAADVGLLVTAHRLALAADEGEDGALAGPAADGHQAPGTLRDLFVVARLREALRQSAAESRWVETA
ncbi:MAG: hypothetical protein ACJ74O_04540 [Frankiaceae bacterium]